MKNKKEFVDKRISKDRCDILLEKAGLNRSDVFKIINNCDKILKKYGFANKQEVSKIVERFRYAHIKFPKKYRNNLLAKHLKITKTVKGYLLNVTIKHLPTGFKASGVCVKNAYNTLHKDLIRQIKNKIKSIKI
jgi:hypothetical protein